MAKPAMTLEEALLDEFTSIYTDASRSATGESKPQESADRVGQQIRRPTLHD